MEFLFLLFFCWILLYCSFFSLLECGSCLEFGSNLNDYKCVYIISSVLFALYRWFRWKWNTATWSCYLITLFLCDILSVLLIFVLCLWNDTFCANHVWHMYWLVFNYTCLFICLYRVIMILQDKPVCTYRYKIILKAILFQWMLRCSLSYDSIIFV